MTAVLENGSWKLSQAVMAKNFRPAPTWVPAVVTKQLGPLTFLVTLRNGQRWKQDMNHIRRYEHGEQVAGDQQDEEADFPVKHEPAPTPSTDTDGTQAEPELPVNQPERYPVRDRHAPDRLM